MLIHHDRFSTDPFDALDDEIPYPEWMEADLYSDAFDDQFLLDDTSSIL